MDKSENIIMAGDFNLPYVDGVNGLVVSYEFNLLTFQNIYICLQQKDCIGLYKILNVNS